MVQEGVTGIGSFAFFKHPALESAILPAGLKSIGVCAFGNCGKLSEAALPEGLTHLGNEAFKSTALKSVVLPESLETLDGRAFAECAALESATINGKLSDGLFSGCTCSEERDLQRECAEDDPRKRVQPVRCAGGN